MHSVLTISTPSQMHCLLGYHSCYPARVDALSTPAAWEPEPPPLVTDALSFRSPSLLLGKDQCSGHYSIYYDMYARHDVVIESGCLWLEDVN